MNKNKIIKNIVLASLFIASAAFFYILGSGGLARNNDDNDEFKITLSSTSGGSITSNVSKAKEGDSIFISISINENYDFKEWEIIDGEVDIENNEFVMPASDVSIKAIFEEKQSQTSQVEDMNLLNDVLNIFSGRLGYDYCGLDVDILNELYFGNMDVNSLSNEALLLITINNETIEGEFGSLLNKSYLNNKIKNILNTNKEIDFSSINAQITNYSYEDYSADEINIKMNIFGCVEGLDDIAKSIISGEEDDNHLYIYERIAFGESNEFGKISYYKDPEFNDFVEEVEYDEQISSSMVSFDLYNLYKYTFIKHDNSFKLAKIEKLTN